MITLNKKNVKQLADGTLEVLPLSGTPGDLTIFHIYNVPSKFVCHLRYKQVCSSSDAGAGIQIGGHKMHLGCTGDGYSLFLSIETSTGPFLIMSGFGKSPNKRA